jgi:hypothetical protein
MQDFTGRRRRLHIPVIKRTGRSVPSGNHFHYDVNNKFERGCTGDVELYAFCWLDRALLLRELRQPPADSFLERREQDSFGVCALDGRNHRDR